MTTRVVDASAIAAVLFAEPEAAPVVAMLRGARLLAPSLLHYELANACLIKCRRYPEQAAAILESFALLDQLPIDIEAPDWAALPALAQRHGLTAYDAAYLQLALRHGAVLVTLDARLMGAAEGA